MVEYSKTKKGYFYKLKKNGEKKRISQEEYNRKNKIRKMIGGGRTKDEIIDELKNKGKYDEWVRLGSKFGLTSDTLKAERFLTRPYKYYDVDGEIVNVSMVQPTYRPDVDNIALFNQHVVEDPTYVKPSTFRIEEGPLSTSGLLTCSGLAMIIGTKKFMTHLAANTLIEPIIYAIKDEIVKEKIDPKTLIPFIYTGKLKSPLTLQKAKNICSSVGIPEENYKISRVCINYRVHI
jgi:hypothetical protein